MRWDVINYLIEVFKYDWYLEIGTAQLGCFTNIKCKYKIGMDPKYSAQGTETEQVYKMTSDEFFAQQKGEYNISFIDGLHNYEQVVKDIINVWNVLRPGGFIIMHDCYPLDAQAAERQPVSPYAAWNGDVFRSILWFKETYPNIYCHVIFTDHGLGTIYKALDCKLETNPRNLLSYVDYDYTWLMDNLDRLGIITVEEFKIFVDSLKEGSHEEK